jgi:hypothetical protein
MAVTKKNTIFWDVTLRGSCENQLFSEMSVLARATWRNILEESFLQYGKEMFAVVNLESVIQSMGIYQQNCVLQFRRS